jgi:cyclomaltodextrinase
MTPIQQHGHREPIPPKPRPMTVPAWVQDAIFYQIFPDRFANGDPSNDPVDVQPWGAPPDLLGFQGGDLWGIIQRFDYLLELGVNALYLNPIFLAASNHRYDTIDYCRVDPRLGDQEDFKALLELAHKNGMRVILDGVFNHCGRGFFAFQDLLKNEDHSGYKDWFYIHRFPLDAYGEGKAENYEAWWNMKSLPKFNVDTPQVRRYLLDVARYWIQQGVDGWRLDVPNEIEDDSFWAAFRAVVKETNPQAYLVGEIWEVDPSWVGERRFDGLMNYPVRKYLLDFLKNEGRTVGEFAGQIRGILDAYDPDHTFSHYLPLGSHDTARIRTELGGDVEKVKLAFQFIFTYPGAPSIFYGDEVGLEGEKDPHCRQAFPWDPSSWDLGLQDHIRRLITLRKKHPLLRRGELRFLPVEGSERVCAYARTLEGGAVVVVLNASASQSAVAVDVEALNWRQRMRLIDGFHGGEFWVEAEARRIKLELAPWQGCVLSPAD